MDEWFYRWYGLNPRQRRFLWVINLQREERKGQEWLSHQFELSPWIAGIGGLDRGTGSTYRALERRGYVERNWMEDSFLLGGRRLLIRLTPLGEQLWHYARDVLGEFDMPLPV